MYKNKNEGALLSKSLTRHSLIDLLGRCEERSEGECVSEQCVCECALKNPMVHFGATLCMCVQF